MNMRSHMITLLAAVLCSAATAAEPPSSNSDPLDDQLRQQFQSDPLDEFGQDLFEPDATPGGPSDTPGGPSDRGDLEARLRQELGSAADSEDENPLLHIARQMRQAEQRIAGFDSSAATQQLQQNILDDLVRMLEQARKQCRQAQAAQNAVSQTAPRNPNGQPTPGQPGNGSQTANAAQTTAVARPGNDTADAPKPDMQQMNRVIRGLLLELPQRDRQQVLQLPVEEFLPGYEPLIEEYYRRLSKEKSGARPWTPTPFYRPFPSNDQPLP